ncbi:MAG: hypothetical protein CMK09_02090 [Ponticaulis sp.]|nr:hypothetical protein [Ponticaulis sp.]|tara:strand:+ start:92765 stop:93256 length:492 start_codon:yes stop_codon:yes gene_type:complete
MLRQFVAVSAIFALTACGGSEPVPTGSDNGGNPEMAIAGVSYSVSEAYVRKPLDGQSSTAAYFILQSNTENNSLVFNVTTDIAETAELHSHDMSGGMMQMRKLENVELKAGETVEFAPFGYHIMLFNVSGGLETGDNARITLDIFSNGNTERISFDAPIKPLN